MASERIVAVGLLTRNDVRLLGPAFDRLWPVGETPVLLGAPRGYRWGRPCI